MEGCKRQWGITDEMIRQAEKSWVSQEEFKFKIKFSTKKKQNTDRFVELMVYPRTAIVSELLVKDLHY